MIRIEKYSDLYFLDVVQIIKNFHAEAVSEYDDLFDADALIQTIKTADPDNAFVLIKDEKCEGLLFGARFDSPTSGRTIFQEIAWYVNEPARRYGIKLLEEAEKVLKSEGVSLIIMAVLENSKTEKLKAFYERLGYKKMETHYMRPL